MIVFMMQGPPGCGKTTLAKKIVADYNSDGRKICRISLDELREMMHSTFRNKDNERQVLRFRAIMILEALHENYSVVLDATHLSSKYTNPVRKLLRDWNSENPPERRAELIVVRIDTPLDECLTRNARRSGIERVPDSVIRDMYRKYKQLNPPNREYTELLDIQYQIVSGA